MRGYSYIIDPMHGQQPTCEYAAPLDLDTMQAAVKGPIEPVPYFRTAFTYDGSMATPYHSAMAFCNEEGKITGLTYNKYAQDQWYNAIALQTHRDVKDVMLGWANENGDVLVGPILVVWGDEEFMKAL